LEGDARAGRKVKRSNRGAPASPEQRWGLPEPPPERLSEGRRVGIADALRNLGQIASVAHQPFGERASHPFHDLAEEPLLSDMD
jgi:hypothetical protein